MHATVVDCLADTAQNSIEAGASLIEVEIREASDEVRVTIQDNGKGMEPALMARVWDPFYTEPGKHALRRVGLGLPLVRQMAEATGGHVELESRVGVGTKLTYVFDPRHVDMPPMGDIPGTVLTLFNYDGAFELVFRHQRGEQSYTVRRQELQEALGDLTEVGNMVLARTYLAEQEQDL